MKKIKGLNIEEVKNAKTLKQFNETYTIKVHGFKTVDEFNQTSSCDQHITNIKIPILAINAKDDPFVNPKLLSHYGNPNVITVGTGLFISLKIKNVEDMLHSLKV
jgi:predicted alpha/beta-fold hydrolase